MKYASKIFADMSVEPKTADLRKFSRLEPGQVVATIDGSAYRVKSKIATPDGVVFKLANLQGKPVPTPADFRPVGLAMAHLASWMRYHLAFNRDFDLYVNSYIEQYNNGHPDKPLPYPIGHDGKPFRWSKWFQGAISPKLHTPVTGEEGQEIKDEAIHEMLFTTLGKRRVLDQFAAKTKSLGANPQNLATKLTDFLISSFTYMLREMNQNIKGEYVGREEQNYLKYLRERLEKTKNKKQRAEIEQKIQETEGELSGMAVGGTS